MPTLSIELSDEDFQTLKALADLQMISVEQLHRFVMTNLIKQFAVSAVNPEPIQASIEGYRSTEAGRALFQKGLDELDSMREE